MHGWLIGEWGALGSVRPGAIGPVRPSWTPLPTPGPCTQPNPYTHPNPAPHLTTLVAKGRRQMHELGTPAQPDED